MSARPQDIDQILQTWAYKPGVISARKLRTDSGREVVQMRIEMGVLRMEVYGRPDGGRPEGAENYLDYLIEQQAASTVPWVMSEEQCAELDCEFVQYYHRRMCWLALRDFGLAVVDADHTLAMMDFAAAHSPDPQWTLGHEQSQPFVLFHRTQAAAFTALEHSGADSAIEEINRGLQRLRTVFREAEAEEQFDRDEQVVQLVRLKEWLREEYHVGQTLEEQLAEAVAAEQYERAAQLRDQIARRGDYKHA